LPFSVVGTH